MVKLVILKIIIDDKIVEWKCNICYMIFVSKYNIVLWFFLFYMFIVRLNSGSIRVFYNFVLISSYCV